MGVDVEAPNDVLNVSQDGKYKVGYDGSGKMITFKPKGSDIYEIFWLFQGDEVWKM